MSTQHFGRPAGICRKALIAFAIGSVIPFIAATTASAQGMRLAADFNGDGTEDLAVGAPKAGGRRQGTISIFFGVRGVGFATTAKTPDLVRLGSFDNEGYGSALAAGDFDGDGRSELVVGAPDWNLGRGRVEVLRFRTSGEFLYATGKSYHQDTYDNAAMRDVAEPGDWFGRSLTTGDFDGNGRPDIAIGVPGEDIEGVYNAGAVQVLYARSAGITLDGNQFWSQRGTGIEDEHERDDQFGSALTSADFNGDGIDDVAVGVPYEDDAFIDQGMVNVIFGTPLGLSSKGDFPLKFARERGGQFSGAFLGYALGAGDINGDGFADLAMGGPYGLNKVGFVAVTYGAPGGLGYLFDNWQIVDLAEPGDQLGYSITVADFNADGFADVAAGAPGEALSGLLNVGAVTVFYGQSGFAMTRQQFLHQNTYGVEDKIETRDFFGTALSAGDYNGDGLADLAIGVRDEDIGSIIDAGVMQVILGASTGLEPSLGDFLLLPAIRESGAWFGFSSR